MNSFTIIMSKSMQQKRSAEKNNNTLSMNNDIYGKIEELNFENRFESVRAL